MGHIGPMGRMRLPPGRYPRPLALRRMPPRHLQQPRVSPLSKRPPRQALRPTRPSCPSRPPPLPNSSTSPETDARESRPSVDTGGPKVHPPTVSPPTPPCHLPKSATSGLRDHASFASPRPLLSHTALARSLRLRQPIPYVRPSVRTAARSQRHRRSLTPPAGHRAVPLLQGTARFPFSGVRGLATAGTCLRAVRRMKRK